MIRKAAEVAADSDGPAGQGKFAVNERDHMWSIHFAKGLAEGWADLTDENHGSAEEVVGIENRIWSP